MKTAVFVGGAFDMTKRQVDSTQTRISFFEPYDPGFCADHNIPDQKVDCRIIWYRLQFKTSQGVLIYEYDLREK